MEIVRIPLDRMKSLIGEGGRGKKLLERRCRVTLSIDAEGEVRIEGESSDEFFARDIVKAIGRGFRPEDALNILKENHELLILDLKDFVKTDKAAQRVKARVIGEDGRVKKEIEAQTESVISVYGHTIGIIASLDTMEYAHSAVVKLLEGAPHSTVFNYLSKARRKSLEERLRGV